MLHLSAVAVWTLQSLGRQLRRWAFRLGGLGFIPLGLLDSSLIPLPGSMDVLTILLSAREKQLWLYYAAMATVGSVVGAVLTYKLGKKGGKEALARRVSAKTRDQIQKAFDRWGSGAVLLPALLPPPMPFAPFLLMAGALQYPLKKFVLVLGAGRIVRYTLLAYLSARYGRRIMLGVLRADHPLRLVVIALACVAAAGLVTLLATRWHRPAQA